MKKIKILIAVLISSIAFSQDKEVSEEYIVPNLTFEAGAGINVSFFNTDISEFGNSMNTEFEGYIRVAPSIFGHVKYKFAEGAFLKSGIIINFRGGAYIADDNNVIVTSNQGVNKGKKHRRFRVNYLEIPVMVGYNLRKIFNKETSRKYKPINLALGFTGGFNLSSDFRYNYYQSVGKNSGPMGEVEEEFKTLDFNYANSFLANAIVELSFVADSLKNADFWMYLRYNQSLNNVYSVNQIGGENYKTKMGTFTLGFTFEFL